jgi:hypothetical protein
LSRDASVCRGSGAHSVYGGDSFSFDFRNGVNKAESLVWTVRGAGRFLRVYAEVAFVDQFLRTARFGVIRYLVLRKNLNRPERAGHRAVAAAYTAVGVHDDNSVLLLDSPRQAGTQTGRILAVMTLNRHTEGIPPRQVQARNHRGRDVADSSRFFLLMSGKTGKLAGTATRTLFSVCQHKKRLLYTHIYSLIWF